MIGDHVVLVAGGEPRGVGGRAEGRPQESFGWPRVRRERVRVARVGSGEGCEALEQLRRRRREAHGPLRASEGSDGLGQARDGVVGVQTRTMTGTPPGDQAEPDQGFLADLQQIRPAVIDRDGVTADLADRLGRAREPLGTLGDDELGALDTAVLFIGEEGDDYVPLRLFPRAHEVGDRGQDHGIHVLHIDRPPAPEHPVAHLTREGIDAPSLGWSGHDIEVPVQDQGGLRRVSAGDPRVDVGAFRDGLEKVDRQPEGFQIRADILRGLALPVRLTTTPVRGVEADEIARDLGDFGQILPGRGWRRGRIGSGHADHATRVGVAGRVVIVSILGCASNISMRGWRNR